LDRDPDGEPGDSNGWKLQLDWEEAANNAQLNITQ